MDERTKALRIFKLSLLMIAVSAFTIVSASVYPNIYSHIIGCWGLVFGVYLLAYSLIKGEIAYYKERKAVKVNAQGRIDKIVAKQTTVNIKLKKKPKTIKKRKKST